MKRGNDASGSIVASFLRWTSPLHLLNIYPAAGVSALGWTLARLLGFRCDHYLPLWFFGTLFIYNLDRLKSDPADGLNAPKRTRLVARFPKTIAAVAAISALTVVAVPIWQGDLPLLLLTVVAAIVSLNYSVPLLGFRWKQIPLAKTLFVPLVVTAALLFPGMLQQKWQVSSIHLATVVAWTFSLLLFNVFLCDQRDLQGDKATGVRTWPALLGPSRARRLLFTLYAAILLLSGFLLGQTHFAQAWKWIASLTAAYLALLLWLSARPQTEAFYEWAVEGLLFIPPLAYALMR